jgi:hypothetical protein
MSVTKSSTPSEPLVCRFYELHTCDGDEKDDKVWHLPITGMENIGDTVNGSTLPISLASSIAYKQTTFSLLGRSKVCDCKWV